MWFRCYDGVLREIKRSDYTDDKHYYDTLCFYLNKSEFHKTTDSVKEIVSLIYNL
jgi:hypothetical protein